MAAQLQALSRFLEAKFEKKKTLDKLWFAQRSKLKGRMKEKKKR